MQRRGRLKTQHREECGRQQESELDSQLELHVSGAGGGYTSLNRRDVVTSTVTGDGVTQLTLYPNKRALH